MAPWIYAIVVGRWVRGQLRPSVGVLIQCSDLFANIVLIVKLLITVKHVLQHAFHFILRSGIRRRIAEISGIEAEQIDAMADDHILLAVVPRCNERLGIAECGH